MLLFNCYGKIVIIALTGFLFLTAPLRAADALCVSETTWKHKNTVSKAYDIENEWYTATLVPERGGRILQWLDKQTDRNLVYDNGYGGLLDDHGALIEMPYEIEWLEQTPDRAVVRLRIRNGDLLYEKTLYFFADRPVIQVRYHIENHGQESARLLFRNVVRPGGTEFSGRELYCYSRVVGLQRHKGMPRTDDQADPWCALVDPDKKSAVAASFEGDALERLYTWRGSKVAPTFEFMFKQMQAGHQMDVQYCWTFGHGLSAVDYAHRTFLAQLEGRLQNEQLTVDLDLLATWAPMPDLKISGQVLDPARKPMAQIAEVAMSIDELDALQRISLLSALPGMHDYVILVLKLESETLPEPIIIEKPFAREGKVKALESYRRPVRWLGEPIIQRPIPGWKKDIEYVIKPDETDRKRGCMVFEPTGERAGQRAESVQLDLAQCEPEAFPLHFHSLTYTGVVAISMNAPGGFSLESFVPEQVPQENWGKTVYGLKLNPDDRFTVAAGDDRVLYFRLKAGDPAPGKHRATITFLMPDLKPVDVAIDITVYPVRFPRQPYMVIDVNNIVNDLCADPKTFAWSPERAENYLGDMDAHGVRGQCMMGGNNAPNERYWYDRVKVRPDGISLPQTIKDDHDRFLKTELPPLDFSFWDPLVDFMLAHGQTHVRWPIGGASQTGFMKSHNRLTSLVYGQVLPAGDIRGMVLKEWYNRELNRYLRERGMPRVMITIDDEIPPEKLGWWVQHAWRGIQMGLEPGVTQSAETIADDMLLNLVAPFMKYWIIGDLHKETLDLRRRQGIIRPEHWVTTYESSACHWRTYDAMRASFGMETAFFDLDACWAERHSSWRQSDSIIYPGAKGPISSASWEGARDGVDDGNYLLLVRSLIAGLPDTVERKVYTERMQAIVGMQETSIIRFTDRLSAMGMITGMDVAADTARFRLAKRKLLDLVVELADKAPIQKAAADFGLHPLIRDGQSLFEIPASMRHTAAAAEFLQRSAGALAFNPPVPVKLDAADPYPVLFVGSLSELKTLLPALAAHPDLADIDVAYPAAGTFAMRFVRKPPSLKKKEKAETMPESLVIICGDEAGVDKAVRLLPNVIRQPKSLYSHWLLKHRLSSKE